MFKRKKKTVLQQIEEIQYPLVEVVFQGVPVIVKLRELTQAQIIACGGDKFSLIETISDKVRQGKTPRLQDLIDYAEIQNKIAKMAMVSPTYEEVFDICAKGFDLEKTKKDILEIEELIATMKRGKQRRALEEEVNALRIKYDLLLPEDFLSFITSYALGIDKSDIKKVTEDGLIRAALLARNGHDNPSDHYSGMFTDFNKDDINMRAWALLIEKEKEEKQR